MSLFKKKSPRKGEFGSKPVVNGKATNKMGSYDPVTVCKIILTQILKIEDITLDVITNDKVVSKFDTKDLEMAALLDGYPEMGRYILHLRSTVSPYELLSVICHEMIHLRQYYSNQLRLIGTTFSGKGKTYENIDYWSRPGEKEARSEQYQIEKQVKKLYYE